MTADLTGYTISEDQTDDNPRRVIRINIFNPGKYPVENIEIKYGRPGRYYGGPDQKLNDINLLQSGSTLPIKIISLKGIYIIPDDHQSHDFIITWKTPLSLSYNFFVSVTGPIDSGDTTLYRIRSRYKIRDRIYYNKEDFTKAVLKILK